MPVLKLQNLSKHFGKTKALSNISLHIKDGIFCVVLGPSGCGKSTLLNLIAGLEEPTEGKIYLGDKDITDVEPHKRNIAMVFQNYALYPHLSVFENIAFGLRVKREKEKKIKEEVRRVSEILNIEDMLHKFPRQLSGGERQRVATGRAIVREPALFLFDEPLSNLDARLRIDLRAELIKLHKHLKKTTIYVTHDQIEAMSLGEIIVVLKKGVIQQISSPGELYHNPENLFVAEFIGTPPMNVLKLRLKKQDNTLLLKRENFSQEVPDNFKSSLNDYIDKDIYLGFRPSAAKIGTGPISGEVIFTETIGEESYAHVRIHPEVELNIKIDNLLPKPQEKVSIAINFEKAYLFELSGRRI